MHCKRCILVGFAHTHDKRCWTRINSKNSVIFSYPKITKWKDVKHLSNCNDQCIVVYNFNYALLFVSSTWSQMMPKSLMLFSFLKYLKKNVKVLTMNDNLHKRQVLTLIKSSIREKSWYLCILYFVLKLFIRNMVSVIQGRRSCTVWLACFAPISCFAVLSKKAVCANIKHNRHFH